MRWLPSHEEIKFSLSPVIIPSDHIIYNLPYLKHCYMVHNGAARAERNHAGRDTPTAGSGSMQASKSGITEWL